MAEERPQLAVIGLGRMGMPICRRLISAGFPVTATDMAGPPAGLPLAPAVADGVGARWVQSATEACRHADIAVTVLPGPQEVMAVTGEITGALAAGTCWLDLSTASPAVSVAVRQSSDQRRIGVVDAPMGGGPAEAGSGQLLLFAGGSEATLAQCRPVLDALARRVIHAGPPGSGYAVKLLVNALWFGQAVALAEALTVAARLELDLPSVLDVVNVSAAASRFSEQHGRELLAGDDMDSFSLSRCREELASMLALGDELGVALPVASAVDEVHRAAIEHYGDMDGELLGARWVAERAGVQLARGMRSEARSVD